MSDLEEKISFTAEEIRERAEVMADNLLPEKSRKMYEKFYRQFMDWRLKNNINSFSENVLLVYFEELSKKMKSTSLWTHYSIIKSTLNLKHATDITKYDELIALLKRQSEGYKTKKSKTFSPEEIKYFLNEAPDDQFLLTKVILIFGIIGACRRHELHDIKFQDVKDLGSVLLVTIPNTNNKSSRSFMITGNYYNICKKYLNLRPSECTVSAFFLNYLKGKCTAQNVGINKMGNMGKQIATYLNLPDPKSYTGHCFRRSSATLLVDAEGDISALKRHGRWKSTALAGGYVDESVQNKIVISNEALNSFDNTNYNTNVNTLPTSTATKGGLFPQINFNNCTTHNVYMGQMTNHDRI